MILLLFINYTYKLHSFSQPTRSTILYTRRSNPENSVGALALGCGVRLHFGRCLENSLFAVPPQRLQQRHHIIGQQLTFSQFLDKCKRGGAGVFSTGRGKKSVIMVDWKYSSLFSLEYGDGTISRRPSSWNRVGHCVEWQLYIDIRSALLFSMARISFFIALDLCTSASSLLLYNASCVSASSLSCSATRSLRARNSIDSGAQKSWCYTVRTLRPRYHPLTHSFSFC